MADFFPDSPLVALPPTTARDPGGHEDPSPQRRTVLFSHEGQRAGDEGALATDVSTRIVAVSAASNAVDSTDAPATKMTLMRSAITCRLDHNHHLGDSNFAVRIAWAVHLSPFCILTMSVMQTRLQSLVLEEASNSENTDG